MRRLLHSLLFILILSATAWAQVPVSKPASCPIEHARPVTDADRALAGGDLRRAEELFRQQSATKADASSYAGVVHSLLQQNRLAEALVSAQGAAGALPASAQAQSLVGEVLARSGKIPESSAAFSKALSLDPCSARAHFGQGRLNELAGRHLTASREIAVAHKLAPDDPEIAVAAFGYLNPSQRAEAMRSLLAAKPLLMTATRDRLTTELALMDHGKFCTATEKFGSAKLNLEPVMFSGRYTRSWGLATEIDGAKMPLLELDSSTSGIVLNPQDAERAGVHTFGTTKPSATEAYTGFADKIRIGTIEYHDCPIRVAPADALAGANSLIGTDFFRDHLIKIDYVANRLSLSPLPTPAGGDQTALTDQFVDAQERDWSPFYSAGGSVLIPTLINKEGPFLFLMDTGSIRSVLSPALATSRLAARADQSPNLHGSSGTIIKVLPHEGGANIQQAEVRGPSGALIPVYTPTKLPVYRFTRNEAPNPLCISFDLTPMSEAFGTEVSGLLGFDLLHGYLVEINYRDNLVHILYDQNRRYDSREADRFF